MDKIKNIGLRIFNWGKKHRVLSILLCLLLIAFCFKGIVWIYNDIAYGRFVKVGEIKSNKPNNTCIKLDDSSILLFVENQHWNLGTFYEIYHIKNKITKKKTIISAFMVRPFATYNNKVFLLFIKNSNLLNKSENTILEYDYQKDIITEKRIKTFPYATNVNFEKLDGENVLIFNKHPALKNNKGIEYLITIFNVKTLRSKILQKYYRDEKYNISLMPPGNSTETEDLHLVAQHTVAIVKNNNHQEIVIQLIDVNSGIISNVDTEAIKQHNNYKQKSQVRKKLIWLNKNDFLVITYPVFGKYTFFDSYSLIGTRIIKQKSTIFYNKSLFNANRISPNNYSVINNNHILFIGGYDGIAETSWINKSCFLYDINKNKIYQLNNFKYRIKNQKIVPFQNGALIFGGYKIKNIFLEPVLFNNIFLFKNGIKTSTGVK